MSRHEYSVLMQQFTRLENRVERGTACNDVVFYCVAPMLREWMERVIKTHMPLAKLIDRIERMLLKLRAQTHCLHPTDLQVIDKLLLQSQAGP